jgi:hypothetical protein
MHHLSFPSQMPQSNYSWNPLSGHLLQPTQKKGKWRYGITIPFIQRTSWILGHFSFTNFNCLNTTISKLELLPNHRQKNNQETQCLFQISELSFSLVGNLLIYCCAHTPSITHTTQCKIFVKSTTSTITSWRKKNKPHYLQTTIHKINRKHNKCRMMTPFTPYDAQLSLVLAPSVSPKP